LAAVPSSINPILVLIHGTFVETTSTFGKLWLKHPDAVQALFKSYADAVYALDHPTLGASPITNARTLVDALPNGARLHLLTHSRGGLVAEVLARLASQQGATAADLAFFADAAYAGQRKELSDLAALIKAKGIQVERVVRVACPARGTLLASKRLDAYVSVLKWTLELTGLVVVPAFVDFVGEVARRRADPSEIPGLAAMMPDTPLVNWLNAAPQPIPGDLRVV
jgi:pimeloyl-ACP methyl ester carboxylesterase